jgi:hypothetical protein
MQLPSNKVGLVLIIVVLGIASTIFFTKINAPQKLADLKTVDLLVERNTTTTDKAGDADKDGLFEWQEELYGSDSNNPDTDGDGTFDGEEIQLKRDPTIEGPNDPLLTTKDYFNTQVDMSNFATGTVIEKLSVDLFSQYLNLKKNNELTEEKQTELVSSAAKTAVEGAEIKDFYFKENLNIAQSTIESVEKYGDDFAQVSIKYYTKLDSLKSLPEAAYLKAISDVYFDFSSELAQIDTPGVAADVHIKIVNRIYQTGTLIRTLVDSKTDPLVIMVAIGHHQKVVDSDAQLYTSLAEYFKTNGIIFDNATTIRFWNYFEN